MEGEFANNKKLTIFFSETPLADLITMWPSLPCGHYIYGNHGKMVNLKINDSVTSNRHSDFWEGKQMM